ncbi:hypothetical protein [Oceanobacillus halotolerans]|uniref:hypothetical protein n=1 Tax=Oceanobacillus halotolerans TaxID=2663380 RepID=UPI0013D99C23|nr:hypothetical protein [Oceanobacillus halotolerans]
MTNDFFNQFYRTDPESGYCILEITLKNYDDVFANWDSSIYKIRDLNANLKSFLEEFSYEIDPRTNIKLLFHMQDEVKDTNMETHIKKGISNYFNYRHHFVAKKTKQSRKKSLFYFSVSILFTILSTYFQPSEENKFIQEFIILNVTVGSWVFLWEAFSLLFMRSRDLSKKKKHYERIVSAPILFKYY